MSPDEFDLFSTYLYLFGNKHVKFKLSFFRIFLMYFVLTYTSHRQLETSQYKHALARIDTFH